MQAIADLKALVLEMLEGAFQGGEVHATQQLGVNMSNAVKREGGVIIQNQKIISELCSFQRFFILALLLFLLLLRLLSDAF